MTDAPAPSPVNDLYPSPFFSGPGWFRRWREARAAKAHARWEKEFLREFDKSDSKVHATVLLHARAMARGMVMRHYDDTGQSRCVFCINTHQLRKRVIQQTPVMKNGRPVPRQKIVMVCPDHEHINLPDATTAKLAEALGPGVGRRPPEKP